MHEISITIQKKYSRKIVKKAKKGKVSPQPHFQSIIKKKRVVTFLLNRNERGKLQAMVVSISQLAL